MTTTHVTRYQLSEKCDSTYCTLHIAGDYDTARQVVREYAFQHGTCVQLAKVDYIYTGGEEAGITARFMAYPRFPKELHVLQHECESLALKLAPVLCQKSFSIETPVQTLYYTSTNSLHQK